MSSLGQYNIISLQGFKITARALKKMEFSESFENQPRGNSGYIDRSPELRPSNTPEELTDFVENSIYQCCKELGIPHEQLLARSLNDFQDSKSKQSAAIRFQHHEARRKACLQVISNYIQNQGVLSVNLKSYLSQSIGPKSKEKPDITLFVPISPRQVTAYKLKLAKQTIMRRLKVEQNRQKLNQAQAEERSLKEKALMSKLSKSVKKDTNKPFFETHEKRIQEILHKKYKNLQEREEKALEPPETKKEETRGHSFLSSQRKSLAIRSDDEDIEQRLSEINSRLSSSVQRAKKTLNQKANPGCSNLGIIEKVQQNKEEIENREEQYMMRKIHKIQNDLTESYVRFR